MILFSMVEHKKNTKFSNIYIYPDSHGFIINMKRIKKKIITISKTNVSCLSKKTLGKYFFSNIQKIISITTNIIK